MGLYSVFLALGQISGAFVGAAAAEVWALDGILAATLLLMAVALLPLARLRRFELEVEGTPVPGPQSEPGAPVLVGAATPRDDGQAEVLPPGRGG